MKVEVNVVRTNQWISLKERNKCSCPTTIYQQKKASRSWKLILTTKHQCIEVVCLVSNYSLNTNDDLREGHARALTLDGGFPICQERSFEVQVEWLVPSLQPPSCTSNHQDHALLVLMGSTFLMPYPSHLILPHVTRLRRHVQGSESK